MITQVFPKTIEVMFLTGQTGKSTPVINNSITENSPRFIYLRKANNKTPKQKWS